MYNFSCRGLVKQYKKGGPKVLDDVTVELHRGEMMMVVGEPGSGKTTLLMTLCGMIKPDCGDVSLFNRNPIELRNLNQGQFFLSEVGAVFQAPSLLSGLTSKENVALPLLMLGINEKTALSDAKRLLTELRMDKQDQLPEELSRGEMQLTELARSMIARPKLYILDDPISQVDHQTGVMILTFLRKRVSEEGATVLLTTHDHRVLPFADRIIRMKNGKIVDRLGEKVDMNMPPFLKL